MKKIVIIVITFVILSFVFFQIYKPAKGSIRYYNDIAQELDDIQWKYKIHSLDLWNCNAQQYRSDRDSTSASKEEAFRYHEEAKRVKREAIILFNQIIALRKEIPDSVLNKLDNESLKTLTSVDKIIKTGVEKELNKSVL